MGTDFKSLSGREKLQYLWDYYRVPVFIGAVILTFVITILVQYFSYREPVFSIIMINCNHAVGTTAEGYYDFLDEIGYQYSESDVALTANLNIYDDGSSTTVYDRQVLNTLLYTGGQDLFFGTGEIYYEYVKSGALSDLRDVLSAETLEKYNDALLTAVDEETGETYPCAITLTDNAWVKKYDYYSDVCYVGVPWRAGNPELAGKFLEYLSEDD